VLDRFTCKVKKLSFINGQAFWNFHSKTIDFDPRSFHLTPITITSCRNITQLLTGNVLQPLVDIRYINVVVVAAVAAVAVVVIGVGVVLTIVDAVVTTVVMVVAAVIAELLLYCS